MRNPLTSDNYYKTRLLKIIKEKALELNTDRELSSGKHSSFYIDGKMVTLHPEGAYLTGKVLYDAIEGDTFDSVGGLTIGADPMVAALAAVSHSERRPINTFIVRKEAKEHGTMKLIEGYLEKGNKVIIVDDVATTGGSILKAIDAIEKEGCTVSKIIVLVDRQQGAKECFSERGYDFAPIFTRADLGVDDE